MGEQYTEGSAENGQLSAESDIHNHTQEESLSAKLVICTGKGELQEAPLSGDILIGSGTEEGILTIHSEYAARMHGKFLKTEDGFSYQDLGTRNGTYLNGIRIGTGVLSGKDCFPLEDGDVLRIEGDVFTENDQEQTVVLVYRKKYMENVEWRTVSLRDCADRIYISRHEEKTGDDEAFVENASIPQLPGHYAVLSNENGKWILSDKNTKYGVYVNNQRMLHDCELREKDVIRIGNTLFFYREDELVFSHKESAGNQLMIHIEERSVWNFFRKKILLEDIDLTINPGEMVLILGGSGAGKTTFINAVMGYEKAKGTIMEGEKDIYRNYNQMKYEIGFVPQQDLLRGEDTVYDTLDNAAELKLPRNLSRDEREKRIGQMLETFGLDREKDSLVEKLSGGQRKRLSIALEFIADPSLFFLDEPDSGLDGVMARALMENLRRIADQQKIVIVITHAPDRVDDLFDKVVVLAKSEKDDVGHLAFYGFIEEAKDFFETDSMEGIVKKINRQDEGGEGRADEFISKYQSLEGK
ncbi:MAG: ATP-binding cassette domain-containing protein [Eubacteriales bacterium]|nr:ATP-binding cassette domain-containing protein [Eubacteriales bacterium]